MTAALWLIVWMLLCISFALAHFARQGKNRGETFRESCLQTQGEVVGLVEVESSEPPNTLAARIRFSTSENQKIEFQTLSSSRPAQYCLGQKVQVFYPPAHPEKARVAAEAYDYDSWVTCAVASVGLVIVALLALFRFFVG